MSDFYTALSNTSSLEYFAFLTSILYVLLAAYQHTLAWFFAFVSSALFVWLCYDGNLFLESFLQFFYVVMAVVGYFQWQNTKQQKTQAWSFKKHLFFILLLSIIVFILGAIFSAYTQQSLPYLDAFTTVFSLFATFLLIRKVIENWLYWIVIDVFSIYLYAYKSYYLSASLYVLYVFLALFAYKQWQRKKDEKS